MTDRELLELAAKAAGLDARYVESYWLEADPSYTGMLLPSDEPWNPLTDDGDALRLAVKLSLKIEHHEDSVVVWHDYFGTGYIPYKGDACAATRLAITLSAAEIGQDMP